MENIVETTEPIEENVDNTIYYGDSIQPVVVNGIATKTPIERVEQLALKNNIIHKHPLRMFKDEWSVKDPKTRKWRMETNKLHKYYNDVIRRVRKTGYTEEDIKKLGHDNYVSFFRGMAGYGKDETEQNRLWWKAIDMSPENQGTWFRDKNIDYQKYNKWSNEVSKGWREGGNSESFRNSPYNKLGLLMAGVVALPALPMLADTVASNPYSLELMKEAGKQGFKWLLKQGAKKAVQTTLGVGTAEAAYDLAVPYLEKFDWFKQMQNDLRRWRYTDYDGAQSAKKIIEEVDNELKTEKEFEDAYAILRSDADRINNHRWPWEIEDLYEKYEVTDNNLNTLSNIINGKWNETVGKHEQHLQSLYKKYNTKDLDQLTKNRADIYNESVETFNRGMNPTQIAKTIGNTAIIGSLINSTLKSDAENSGFLESLPFFYLDGLNVAFLKNLYSGGAGIWNVAASELLPAYGQSYVNDGINSFDTDMRNRYKWYADNVKYEHVAYPSAFLFGVPTNKAAANMLNVASGMPKYIKSQIPLTISPYVNDYLRNNHGYPTTMYKLTPNNLEYNGSIYTDGHISPKRWWHIPDNSDVVWIKGPDGDGVVGNITTGERFRYSPKKLTQTAND